jgi:hypothetical protein
MSKTASDIVDRALTLIDEVPTTFATAATTETSIRNQALEILPEVCRDLIKELPWDLKRYLATTATLTADSLSDGEDQSGYFKQKVAFKAPADFWELVSIRLTVWNRPVTEYIYINSENYPKQNNPFTRAGKQSPVVALSNTKTGSDARVECFSINNGDAATVANFQYVSFDNVPNDSGKTWPDQVFDEITKALATELHVIKGRLEEASVKGTEITNALDQHE